MYRLSFYVGLLWLLGQTVWAQPARQRTVDSLVRQYALVKSATRPALAIRLSDAYLYVDPSCSRDYAQAGLQLLQDFPNDTLFLTAINNLAVAYGGLGQNNRADSCFQVGIRRAEALHDTHRLIRLLANQSNTYLDEGRNRDALKRLRTALTYAAGPAHDAARAVLLNTMGAAYARLGIYGPALRYYHAALREADRHHNMIVLGLAQRNIATIYAQLGNPQRSNQLLGQAIKHLIDANDPITANQCRLIVADNWLNMARPDSARPLVWWGMRKAKQTQIPNQLALAYVLMSRLYYAQQRYVQAEINAKQALDLAQHENYSMEGQALMYLARAIAAQGRTQAALPLANQAVMATQQTANRGDRREASRVLADILERDGQLAEALIARKLYESLNDSLYTTGFREQFSQLQVTYETERKEQQIAFLNRENALRERQLKGLGIGLGVVLALLGIVYWLYRREQVASQKIGHQKELLTHQSAQLALLVRELHHRVKNNLQIVSSLLSLQLGRLVDEQARAAVREGQSRVEAMAMLHQRLYATAEVTTVDFRSYVTDLIDSLMITYGYHPGDVDLTIDIAREQIETDTAIPLGLIINELITNSLKYAYKAVSRPALSIRLAPAHNPEGQPVLRLIVADNGPGLTEAQRQVAEGSGAMWEPAPVITQVTLGVQATKKQAQSPDIAQKTTTFGMQLIVSLARQLRATSQFIESTGTQFQLDIPMAHVVA